MIQLKKILLVCLILFSSFSFAQTLTSTEAKTINRAFNELYKLRQVKAFQDTLLGTKDRKIEILEFQCTLRSEQVIAANTKIVQMELERKKFKRQILAYKIGIISTIIISIIIFN